MDKKAQLNLVIVLMVISAVVMFSLAAIHGIWPPAITAVGFLVTAWGFNILK
ncbi:hypothetical protein Nstercoris_01163 [Nitrosomonas stercoris]|uniref:Uncharacterized protein n=1 Tax=Nitrosomonas stercoris TaxID=1444684 RepID=A0A4Y1YL89_9PROT|nr:hypothetical protein Nstercoris_01163 [Nitrosomonas stercoris]